jgi:AcrR family transcriptional regulator
MEAVGKTPRRRPYRAPRRATAAARTRERILEAAKAVFESRGWSGATIRSIADAAGVSPKTVEALFGTKASLLRAVVDFSIRGDARAVPMPRREAVAAMEAATGASTMLDLHAAHIRSIAQRSARIAWVVEGAAPSDVDVAELWQTMTANRRFGVKWAASTLLAKPDADPSLARSDVEATFWIALEWGTYRTLTDHRRLSPRAFEAWLRAYYRRMLLS